MSDYHDDSPLQISMETLLEAQEVIDTLSEEELLDTTQHFEWGGEFTITDVKEKLGDALYGDVKLAAEIVIVLGVEVRYDSYEDEVLDDDVNPEDITNILPGIEQIIPVDITELEEFMNGLMGDGTLKAIFELVPDDTFDIGELVSGEVDLDALLKDTLDKLGITRECSGCGTDVWDNFSDNPADPWDKCRNCLDSEGEEEQ